MTDTVSAKDWKALAEDQRMRARDLLVDIARDALSISSEHRLRRRAQELIAEMDRLTATPPTVPEASREGRATAEHAFMAGWLAASRWADRGDLFADVDSPAYVRDRDEALAKLPHAPSHEGCADCESALTPNAEGVELPELQPGGILGHPEPKSKSQAKRFAAMDAPARDNEVCAPNAALADIEKAADFWADKADLRKMAENIAASPSADAVYSLAHQSFVEGAYTHFLTMSGASHPAAPARVGAFALTDAVLKELNNYGGFDAWWDGIDYPARANIRSALAQVIESV